MSVKVIKNHLLRPVMVALLPTALALAFGQSAGHVFGP